ncbi:hypothetical protein [Deinococcus sp. QL22]|uniref:hypothetical protein n=1 Tax=Deinococcus sp. QL22 TaxID=2939437 RepID=UPI002018029D|nr:hypothetical protein [Deinococcus sp. QL22]UQN09814.1 hypothetical protein M1R55_25450 [Deinococcus sp. QL22]
MFKPGYLFLYFAYLALTAHLPAPYDGLAALCGICSGLIDCLPLARLWRPAHD